MPLPERHDFPALAEARSLWSAAGATDAAPGTFGVAVAERPRDVRALLQAARAFGGRSQIARANRLDGAWEGAVPVDTWTRIVATVTGEGGSTRATPGRVPIRPGKGARLALAQP